ncbi:hypothetical protein [Nocardia arthritidis]|uniref:Uncharacterized protein n=1 Tax=Nocardia arthritidis TaxID=228602 RepID=A0A6G9YEA2_9NOCA|nr:hypothetical protein [Nocardia arthritidis]QIS11494.1 hypothetical protein F5544_18100 [Nocardia arthritidis]
MGISFRGRPRVGFELALIHPDLRLFDKLFRLRKFEFRCPEGIFVPSATSQIDLGAHFADLSVVIGRTLFRELVTSRRGGDRVEQRTFEGCGPADDRRPLVTAHDKTPVCIAQRRDPWRGVDTELPLGGIGRTFRDLDRSVRQQLSHRRDALMIADEAQQVTDESARRIDVVEQTVDPALGGIHFGEVPEQIRVEPPLPQCAVPLGDALRRDDRVDAERGQTPYMRAESVAVIVSTAAQREWQIVQRGARHGRIRMHTPPIAL